MVSLHRHCNDSNGQGTIIEIIGGGEKTPLNTIRLFGMEVPPSGALNMSRSPYLTIGYLLIDVLKDLEFKFYTSMINVKG